MRAGTLEIELLTNVARLQKEMADMKRSVAGAMDGVSASTADAGRSIDSLVSGSLTSVAAKLASFGAAVAVLNKVKDATLEFSAAMTEVSTLVDTSRVSMAELTKEALRQAGAFGTGAAEQANAYYQIISAGASTAAQATATLTAANKLAVGGITDVRTAADGLTSVLNAYGSKAGSATDVSNAMFTAMKAGKTTIAELSTNLGAVAPLAAQMGVSFDELTAATAALTKGGINTSVAVNGLRAILAAVAKPGDEAAKMAAALGIEFSAAAVQSKGLADFIDNINTKTGGNVEALSLLFGGVEALVPVLALSGQAGEDFSTILDQMKVKAGATDEAFAKVNAGAAQQLKVIFATLAADAIAIGLGIADWMTPALTVAAGIISGAEQPTLALDFALKAVAVTAGAVLTRSLWLMLVPAVLASPTFLALAFSVSVAGVASTAAAVGVGFMTIAVNLLLGPVGLAVLAIGALTAAWVYFAGKQRAAQAEIDATAAKQADTAKAAAAQSDAAKVAIKAEAAAAAIAAKAKADASALAGKAAAALKAGAEKKPKVTEEERAIKAAIKATDTYIESLQREIAIFGKTPEQVRAINVARERGTAVTDGQRQAIDKLSAAREVLFAAEMKAKGIKADADIERNTLQPLRDELALIGLIGDARGKALLAQNLAALAAEETAFMADAVTRGVTNADAAWQAYSFTTAAILNGQSVFDRETLAVAAYLSSLDAMASQTQRAAQGMAEAFGSVGGAIGAVASEISQFAADQVAAARKVADAERAYGRTSMQYADARTAQASAEINHYGNLASAAKGFFKQGSAGYKVLDAAEKAFRAYELAIAIKNAAVKIGLIGTVTGAAVLGSTTEVAATATAETAKTGLSIGGALARIPLKIAEGAASIFAALGPFGFPVVAAMLGVMAALGVSALSGGGSKPSPANDGTGTVFGDSAAKSESIAKAIDHLREIDTLTMRYSAAMLASLKSIEANIGGLSNLIIRTNGGEASAAGIQTGFKTSITGVLGAILGPVGSLIKSLFGTKTSIIGQGIFGGAQSLGGIVDGGFQGQYYTDVQKKKKFLGITTSTSYSTQYSAASAELERQFSQIFTGFYDAISAAAGPLGLSLGEVQTRLDSFVVNVGKIDLKGLTGQEIQEKLAAVFGAAADSLARYAVPGLDKFQKVGEGYFETLVRVASSVEAVASSVTMLGRSANLTIAAAMDLVDRFGSASDMLSATGEYFSLYYSNAEQAAARTAQMTAALAGLGLAMPGSIAGFRALVDAQDLTTEAGRAAYVALIQLAPAFADLVGAAQDAASAAAIAGERLSLQRRMLEVQGDTAALRALDLAQLDASNRALQQQIWALEDQTKAAEDAAAAAEKLKSAWAQITDGLIAEIKRIRGVMGDKPSSYAAALTDFNTASMRARAGDQEAAKSLPGLSQTLLSVAADTAKSAEDLARLQGLTASSLEQTLGIINQAAGTTAGSAAATAGMPGWWDQFAANQIAGASPAANEGQSALIDELQALRQEVADMRGEQRIASAAIASGTAKTARILERVTPDGDALATRAAA
jgi:TP901 family phage tail tape measure protein